MAAKKGNIYGIKNWFKKGHKDLVPIESRKRAGLKISKALKGRKRGRNSSKHSKFMKNFMKKNWENQEFREKRIKATLKSMMLRPTSLEKEMIEIIDRNNLPYKYVGDGEFILGGKCPDFININGEKIAIEVRSKEVCKYFTKISPKKYKRNRIEHFSKYGWKCFVFFGKLDENEILNKLRGV